MGKLNLLKAGYEGKLGETYGVAKKGLYDIKANPFSHTPHNNSQITAKDEFTRLNRIASKVVKEMWQYLSLSDKNMYRNNALCKAWKGALKGAAFKLENLKEVIPEEGKLRIEIIDFNPELFTLTLSANEENPDEHSRNQIIYLSVVTNEQITMAQISGKGNSLLLQSRFDYSDFAFFQIWAFKAVPGIKKWQLKGLSISDPIFVVIVYGVFLVNRWRWQKMPFVIDGVLYLPRKNAKIENGVLKLLKT